MISAKDKAIMVNNADWLLKLNYMDLLRDVGACFSVNNMLTRRVLQAANGEGPILPGVQLHDHAELTTSYYLHQNYGCNMQFGGDDQWSNMLGGTDLIRRKLGEDAYAMTYHPADMNSEGKKMGKTAKGAVWLDPDKTSSLRVLPVLAQRRTMPMSSSASECSPSCPWKRSTRWSAGRAAQLNTAKEILAYEVEPTCLVHGKKRQPTRPRPHPTHCSWAAAMIPICLPLRSPGISSPRMPSESWI